MLLYFRMAYFMHKVIFWYVVGCKCNSYRQHAFGINWFGDLEGNTTE
jgi:hypothetical protein